MSKTRKPSGHAEENKRNWPALIWRLMVSLIPFVLLIYYFTYEPAVDNPPSEPLPVVTDSSVVDSLD